MEKYKNPEFSPAERAGDLLARLSLEEKMAQVNCLSPFKAANNYDTICKDAILEARNPSEKGAEVLVKILLGEYNPGGRCCIRG